jgi:hypothetical protein
MEEWEEVRNASKCTDGCFFEQWAGESRAVPGDTRNVLKWNALTNNDRQWQICNKSVAKSANLLARCPSLLQYVWQHRYLKTPLIHVDPAFYHFRDCEKGTSYVWRSWGGSWTLWLCLTIFDYLWLGNSWCLVLVHCCISARCRLPSKRKGCETEHRTLLSGTVRQQSGPVWTHSLTVWLDQEPVWCWKQIGLSRSK